MFRATTDPTNNTRYNINTAEKAEIFPAIETQTHATIHRQPFLSFPKRFLNHEAPNPKIVGISIIFSAIVVAYLGHWSFHPAETRATKTCTVLCLRLATTSGAVMPKKCNLMNKIHGLGCVQQFHIAETKKVKFRRFGVKEGVSSVIQKQKSPKLLPLS